MDGQGDILHSPPKPLGHRIELPLPDPSAASHSLTSPWPRTLRGTEGRYGGRRDSPRKQAKESKWLGGASCPPTPTPGSGAGTGKCEASHSSHICIWVWQPADA